MDGPRAPRRRVRARLAQLHGPERFFRVHRSAIVRFDLIEGLTRNASGDYTVQLKGGLQLKVSRSRSDELERRMGLAK